MKRPPPILDYLLTRQAFEEPFPGYEGDIHGVERESVNGKTVFTTMCIGNLRNGTYYLDKYIQTHSRPYLRRAALYFGIIALFAAGAVIESKLIRIIGTDAIWFSSVLLIASALLMFREARASEKDAFI